MIEVGFKLDEDADCYVVQVESDDSAQVGLQVRIERSTVEKVVYSRQNISLELTPVGRLAAFPERSPGTTLASASLSDLVANCKRFVRQEDDIVELLSMALSN